MKGERGRSDGIMRVSEEEYVEILHIQQTYHIPSRNADGPSCNLVHLRSTASIHRQSCIEAKLFEVA
jgi:hypothetical protein